MNRKRIRGKDVFHVRKTFVRECRKSVFLNYCLCNDKTVMTTELIKQKCLEDVCRERSFPASTMERCRYRIALLIIARIDRLILQQCYNIVMRMFPLS